MQAFSSYAVQSCRIFITTLSGLAFETIPFLLIGTALSSAIHVFVPARTFRRLLPRNRYAAILAAASIGAILPVCECAIVPLARRIRDKGVPESAALAFMLAAPMLNPMTMISTALAFRSTGHPIWLIRLCAGLIIAISVAFLHERRRRSTTAREKTPHYFRAAADAIPRAPFLSETGLAARPKARAAILDFLRHSGDEFLDTSRFLILGISIAALARALIPFKAISGALETQIVAIPTGMASAFLLSLCSSADAFVARTLFLPQSYGAAIAFMLLGPMMDVKTVTLLSRFIRRGDVVRLALALALACLAATVLLYPSWRLWS